jgi:alanyl-tRNA synthetase
MGDAYPELVRQQAQVEKALLAEEEQFARTLDNGMQILEDALAGLEGSVIPGELVFKLYDTYGFPIDLTNDIARERNLTLDLAGYDAAMAAQRARSQEGGSFKVDYHDVLKLEGSTEFTGYDGLAGEGIVTALLRDGVEVNALDTDEAGVLVLDRTPFYGESGGQVGDTGYLGGKNLRLEVSNTTKASDQHLHHVKVLEGRVKRGDTLFAQVDPRRAPAHAPQPQRHAPVARRAAPRTGRACAAEGLAGGFAAPALRLLTPGRQSARRSSRPSRTW